MTLILFLLLLGQPAAHGMDAQEYEARMQLRQIAMYKAQMTHMQRMQQMAAQRGHHGHGH